MREHCREKILIAVPQQNGNPLNTRKQSSNNSVSHKNTNHHLARTGCSSSSRSELLSKSKRTQRHRSLHGERQDSKSDIEKRRQVDQGAELEPTLSRKTPRARTARHVHVADRRHRQVRRSMVAPAMPDFHVAPGPPTGTGGLAVSSPSSSSTLLSSHCRCPPLRRFWSHFCTGVQS